MFVLPYISFDPVLFELGPFSAKYYGLAYVICFLAGWFIIKAWIKIIPLTPFTAKFIDDYLLWAMLGVILGGRIGYLIFYHPDYLLSFSKSIATWEGGMSFHGGLFGLLLASFFYTKKHKVPFLHLTDLLAFIAPIGIFLGRIANYINGELFGRISDVPWAMIFPYGGPFPRHPSQLYEALFEGIILLVLLLTLYFKNPKKITHTGYFSGIFLTFYGLFRIFLEFFREPDRQLGLFLNYFSMGQILSLPMIFAGIYLSFCYAREHKL